MDFVFGLVEKKFGLVEKKNLSDLFWLKKANIYPLFWVKFP
jgi:hypothetical protein